jgi:glycine transporter
VSLDAAGLALFCVEGAQKALDRGLNRLAAVLLGTIGASGGGVVRDVLITRVPTVLREQVYPVAAPARCDRPRGERPIWYLPEDCHVPGLCRLLRPASGHRLAELEPPESDRLDPGPVDPRELLVGSGISLGGPTSANCR